MAIFIKYSKLVLVSSLFLVSCGNTEEETTVSTVSSLPGDKLYQQNCLSCHGKNGDLGVSGATDLSQSVKSTEEKIAFIKTGSGDGIMKPYGINNGGDLSDEEIQKIAEYIDTFVK